MGVQTYRYYHCFKTFNQYLYLHHFQWHVDDIKWPLITHVTASSRVGLTNQTLTPAVRSISQTDLILVDNFGRVSRSVRVR